mmetsp:Transcript_68334/g.187282  ORF Transcript_68334/g.187282 Transcript_68334/m.187282 type:complete len:247 (+) Transcript_68334:1545-2285(+)
MRSQMKRRVPTSTPVVGSSTKTILGVPHERAIAAESLRCVPPDSAFACLWACSVRPYPFSTSSTARCSAAPVRPLSWSRMVRCWRSVSDGQMPLSCGQKPVHWKTSIRLQSGGRPLRDATPAVGTYSPERTLMVVVLPAPLGPRRAKQTPVGIASVRSSMERSLGPPRLSEGARASASLRSGLADVEKSLVRPSMRTAALDASDEASPATRALSAVTSASSDSGADAGGSGGLGLRRIVKRRISMA